MDNNKTEFSLKLNKIKKRKLKKGEADYPTYDFKTIEEIFDALTPENMNRFFKEFKAGMYEGIYMRKALYETAKALAERDGKDISEISETDCIKITSFKWIDD